MNPDRSFGSSTVIGEAIEDCPGILDMAYEDAQRMREKLEVEAGFGPPPGGDCIVLVVPRGKGREWAENLRGIFFTAGPDATYEPDKVTPDGPGDTPEGGPPTR